MDEQDNILIENSNIGLTSNIDLTIASQNKISYFEWNALEDMYDSDHCPKFKELDTHRSGFMTKLTGQCSAKKLLVVL